MVLFQFDDEAPEETQQEDESVEDHVEVPLELHEERLVSQPDAYHQRDQHRKDPQRESLLHVRLREQRPEPQERHTEHVGSYQIERESKMVVVHLPTKDELEGAFGRDRPDDPIRQHRERHQNQP